VREGEIEDIDFITGEIVRGKRKSENVVGYVAYFKLVNGFEKTVYMSKEDVEAHANTFSMSYGADKKYGNKRSVWSTNFDAMALKTVLKQLISKYGIMSIDMQGGDMAAAIASDQAVIREDGTADYVDTEPQNVTPQEPKEFPEELQKNPNGHDIPATEENTSLDFGEPEF
jgi:recombination protein RecT